ncbi:MAG: hypothetical protein ABII85_01300 [Bacillota bacterium]
MNEHAKKVENSKTIYTNSGYISYKYNDDLYFKIARLTYELFENEEYQYVLEPFYDVLNAFKSLEIPGIDLSLRENKYYRSNMTPVFVSERVTPKNRVNLQEELKEYHIDYYQPFLLLLDSKKTYGGDQLSLKSNLFYEKQIAKIEETNDLYKTVSYTLKKLSSRIPMNIGDIEVSNLNRTILIKTYLFLYEKVSAYYDQKSKGNRGRQKQTVSFVVLREIRNQYNHGLISIDEAVKRSGLGSKRTFYRRLKELEESEQNA